MCGPAAVVPLLIASTVMATAGTVVAGVSAANQSKYQAKVANENARHADQAARDALARGRQEEIVQGRRAAQLRGAQTAGLAASGVDIGFGSALDLAGDTALISSEDAAAVRENAVRESRGFSINASNYRSSAVANRQAATGQLVGTAFSAGSTILGGATQIGQFRAAQARGS